MTPDDFDQILQRTLDDGRLSRTERKAIRARLDEAGITENVRNQLRARAFDKARAQISDPRHSAVVDWLEDIVKSLRPAGPSRSTRRPEAHFSPGDTCRDRIVSLLRSTRDSADICVFTITDDRISEAIVDAHERGVRVRVISDNDKSFDLGSDVDRLERAEVKVRVDKTDDHMHHKFALFDGAYLVTGSYNWTRSASSRNWENIVVLGDAVLIDRFGEVFEELWARL